MHRNQLLSRLVFFVSLGLFALAIILAVSICWTEQSLSVLWDRIGFVTFFQLFDIPMKLLAAGFAVFIVWITLIRVNQTAIQLEILDENNRFNNYYKHAEELHKYIAATPLFLELVKSSELDMRLYTSELHRYYYAQSYDRFRPQVQREALTEIERFFTTISHSRVAVENSALIDLPVADLTPLLDAVDPKIMNMLDPFIKKLSPLNEVLKEAGITIDQMPPAMKDNIQRWTISNILYWTEFTYVCLLGFQGIERPSTEFFETNFQRLKTDFGHYLESLGS